MFTRDLYPHLHPHPRPQPASRDPRHLDILERTASYPDVSLLVKMCAQRKAGRRQRARRLADLVFKMAARAMADEYAVFKISLALFILRILSE